MLRLTALGLLVGCAYQPGSFHYRGATAWDTGQRATVGCLDIAVARRADRDASAVVDYRFGNRCTRPVAVDLARVAVVARYADGTEAALEPYDPKRELRPTPLDGRLAGGEALAYPSARGATQICVDAASLVHADQPHWMCFASQPEAVAEVTP